MNRSSPTAADNPWPQLVARSSLGGVLMGLANLVPGISGGTMLLAAGIYPQFIASVSEATRLRFRLGSLVVLGVVGGAAGLGILLLAGVLKDLVVSHRWVMYSLFIGLTLGGLPLVWRMARPIDGRVWVGAVSGLVAMVTLSLLQSQSVAAGLERSGPLLLALAGVAGASAMILPGVSGGYLLLLLGQYLPILGAIEEVRAALSRGELMATVDPAVAVLLPVALGVAAGVAVVSNLLRWLLEHQEKLTLGVLVGLLVGAVFGLWPFQEPIEPVLGETVVRGQVITAENLAEVDPADLPTEYFSPSAGQVAGSILCVAMGLSLTFAVSRIGGRKPEAGSAGRGSG